MPEYMVKALDLAPQPAALFEVGTHELLGINEQAVALSQAQLEHLLENGTPLEMHKARRQQAAMKRYGIAGVLANDADVAEWLSSGESANGAIISVEEAWGFVHVSRLRAPHHHSRPDVLLVTGHPQAEERNSLMDHHRIVVALYLNEMSAVSTKLLRVAQQQINAAALAHEEMLTFFNGRVAEFMSHSESVMTEKMHDEPIDISRDQPSRLLHPRLVSG